VLDDLGPGQFFNLASALDGRRNLATVTASTETTIYAIEREAFRQMTRDHREVAMGVLKVMAGQVRNLSNTGWTQEEIATHIGSVREMVGRTLRAFSRRGIVRREGGRLVVTDLTALKRIAMCE
jgi:CRP-like cAMP-binding protein